MTDIKNGRWTSYMKVIAVGVLFGGTAQVINLSYSAGQTTQRVVALEEDQRKLERKQESINEMGERVVRLEVMIEQVVEFSKSMDRKIDRLIRGSGAP